jgi:hypothetical protein
MPKPSNQISLPTAILAALTGVSFAVFSLLENAPHSSLPVVEQTPSATIQTTSPKPDVPPRTLATDQFQFAVAVKSIREGVEKGSRAVHEAFESIPRDQALKAGFKNSFDCMSNTEFRARDGAVLAKWSQLPKGQGQCNVSFQVVNQKPVFTVVVSGYMLGGEYISINGMPMDSGLLEIARGQWQVREYGGAVYAAIFPSSISSEVVAPADCLSSQAAKDILGKTIAQWRVPPPSVRRCRIERSVTGGLRVIVEGSQAVRGGIFFFGN